MQEILTTQFIWAVLLVGGILGLVVLAKAPELLVAILLIGGEFIQLSLRLLGYEVSRRTFTLVGGAIFIPAVLLFVVVRVVQVREREPIIGRPNFSYVAVAIVMGIWLLIGLTYTDSVYYGPRKTAEYFMFGIAPMILAFVFIPDRAATRRLMLWILLISASNVVFVSSYSLATRGTLRTTMIFVGERTTWGLEVPGHGGLSASVLMGFGTLLYMASARKKTGWKVLPLLFLPLVSFYILYAGTRSNLVAFALIVAVGFLFAYRKSRVLLVTAIILVVLCATIFYATAEEEVAERMFVKSWFDPESRYGGGYGRLEFLKAVPRQFAQAPLFGHGTGGWALLDTGLDVYAFPHNMFAEILVENGVVGLAVVLVLWFLVVRRIWRILRTAEPGTGLYGIAVFGGCLLAIETTNALAHFGIAHAACAFLLTAAVILRATYLEEEAVTSGARPPGEVDTLVRPVLKAGPIA